MNKLTWGAIAALTATALAFPTPASADTKSKRDFECQVEGAASAATGVTLTLDTPESVKAGDSLALSGTLQLSFPDQVAVHSRLVLATKAGLDSTTFSLTALIEGKNYDIRPSEVIAVEEKIGSPFVVTAKVKFAPFDVPSGASGDLTLGMSSEDDVLNPVGKTPERVAFDAVIIQDSTIIKTRKVACYNPDNEAYEPIARLPVAGGVDNAGGDDTPPATDGGTALPPATGSPLGPILAEPPPLTAVPDIRTGTDVGAEAAPELTPTSAAIPPETVHEGTFIAYWALLIMIAFLPAVLIGYVIRQRRLLYLATLDTAGAAESAAQNP